MQLGAVILLANDNQWNKLFYYVFYIYIFFAAAIYFIFVPSPSDVGLELAEQMPEDVLKAQLQVQEEGEDLRTNADENDGNEENVD